MKKTTRVTRRPVARRDDFPLLGTFFRAYLHEDFLEEHASAARALEAYRDDLTPARRRALAAECGRLLAALAGARLPALRRLLYDEFGSAWEPASRDELVELLREAEAR